MTAVDLVLSAAFIAFAALSITLAVIDIRTHRLPNAIVLPAYPVTLVVLTVCCLLGEDWGRLARGLIGALALFVFYLALRLMSPRGMGGGDVKLAGLLGLLLAWVGWTALAVGTLAGFVLGGLYGIGLLAARRADRRTAIPFGPWMLAGAWIGIAVAVWSGDPLLSSVR
ncbi:prepilin peptidase [Microbacterium koreense]|uniref:Prepilin peptidase n=1 Tax=Microbacterium koreense TaxID=323761 RepID=A0ABW2ZT17_9MICO